MNNIIIVDTREKGHKTILKYFKEHNIDYITSKLDYGDYKLYKDNTVVIDRKDNLLELAGNLCHTNEHERIKREIAKFCEVSILGFPKVYPEHNNRYLKQCYYNLQEKYDRGIITKEEWQKIEDFIGDE